MEGKQYQNENEELRQLHQERLLRQKKEFKQEQPENNQVFSKSINPPRQMPSLAEKRPNQIYLNSLVYDSRSKQQKFNNIGITNLMHPNVEDFATRPVSKEVEAVMITNFGFQMEVFEPILKCEVPLFVFNREEDRKEGKISRGFNGFENMTVLSPPKHNQGYGVFHPKLWLIKFTSFLRVVVCTGNNHIYDWAVWQNAYWFHDCPLKASLSQSEKNKKEQKTIDFDFENDFLQTLKWVISQISPQGFDILGQMKINLQDYSFKEVKAILIPSIVGRFKNDSMDKVGLGKIRKVMRQTKTKLNNPTLTANSTSLGTLSQKFIRQVYTSFCPSSGLFSIPNKVRLIYPSHQYIVEQTSGDAEVLFLTPQNYAKCELKNHIFHHYSPSVYNGVQGGIPHLKTIILQEENSDRVVLYMGSHNLTKAAWGSYQKNETQISCNNEELGLLFLDYPFEQLLQWLPYQYPPEKYKSGEQPFLRHL